MKKADIKLIICLSVAGIVAFAAILLCSRKGTTVVIRKNKEQLYKCSLYYNQTIDLGTNVVEIKNGEVDVVWANCNNGDCVKQKKITKKGEQIVCLPNEIIITVK